MTIYTILPNHSGNAITLNNGDIENNFGVTHNINVNGSTEQIFNGGTAYHSTVQGQYVQQGWFNYQYYSGYQEIFSGGAAYKTLVLNGGEQDILAGGYAQNTIVSGGTESVSGGIAVGSILNNYSTQNIDSGGITSNTTLNNNSNQVIDSSSIAIGNILNFSKQDIAGVANNNFLNSSTQNIEQGGTANNTSLNNSTQNISVSENNGSAGLGQIAVANQTTLNNFSNQSIDNGGVANQTTINTNSYQQIFSGGLSNQTIINSGGSEFINGGVASNTTINNGGTLANWSGVDYNTIINSGGIESSTNNSINTIINSGGIQMVSDGTTYNTVVNNGGSQEVMWGTAYNTVVNSGGLEFVNGNATAVGTVISGGVVEFSDYASANEIVDLVGSGGEVKLDNAGDFSGVISGFVATDSIDLTSIDPNQINSLSWQAGQLIINEINGDNIVINLPGLYQNAVFNYSDDNQGGTLITVNQPVLFTNENVSNMTATATNISFSGSLNFVDNDSSASFSATNSIVSAGANSQFSTNLVTTSEGQGTVDWKYQTSVPNSTNKIITKTTDHFLVNVTDSQGVTEQTDLTFNIITANNNASYLQGSSNGMDILIGGPGNDTLSVIGGNDVLYGGKGADQFIISAGSGTIADLGLGRDSLQVSNSATAIATLAGSWVANNNSINNGSVTLYTNGNSVNLAASQGNDGYTIYDNGSTASRITASNNGDTIYGANGDTVNGGSGVDSFYIQGKENLNQLGGSDILHVASGANLSATVSTNGWGWTAGVGSTNAGSEKLLIAASNNGSLFDLSNLSGSGATTIIDKGSNNVFHLGTDSETITAGINDSILGSTGNVVFNATNGDTLHGGSGLNTFNVYGGSTVLIDNLGYGSADVLNLGRVCTANINMTNNWTQTNASSVAGTVNIQTNGYNLDLTAGSLSTTVWNINDFAANNDHLVASTKGIDHFYFQNFNGNNVDQIDFHQGASSAKASQFDTIDISWNNTIDLNYIGATLSTSNADTLTLTNSKSVSFDGLGNVSFNGTNPTTLQGAENEIINAYNHEIGGVVTGDFAAFNFNGNEYLFIISTNGETEVSASDSLIQLTGISQVEGLSGHVIVL